MSLAREYERLRAGGAAAAAAEAARTRLYRQRASLVAVPELPSRISREGDPRPSLVKLLVHPAPAGIRAVAPEWEIDPLVALGATPDRRDL